MTALYFSQVSARAKHFLIETADDTAVDEATSLKRNEPDREVGSLNRQAPPLQAPGAGAGPVLHWPPGRRGDPIAGGHPGAGGPPVYCCHASQFCPGGIGPRGHPLRKVGKAAPGAIFL